jgi:hypothetical protein
MDARVEVVSFGKGACLDSQYFQSYAISKLDSVAWQELSTHPKQHQTPSFHNAIRFPSHIQCYLYLPMKIIIGGFNFSGGDD